MMRLLRNTPIRRKLTFISMLTSGVALLFACGAFIAYEQLIFRNMLVDQTLDTAKLIGYNNSAALLFNDRDSAAESLRDLSHHSAIRAAVIYDRDGKVFAGYRNPTANAAVPAPAVEHDAHHFDDRGLNLFNDVKLDGEMVGTVYIRYDLREMRAVQHRYVVIAGLVMLVALAINWLISARLYRTISGPISHLAAVVGIVSTRKDYSVRAQKQDDDELGGLIDGFNAMLNQIQIQDRALQDAREHLERRVDERTMELAKSLSLLNATLESTTDGIVALDTSGLEVCANSKVLGMWQLPQEFLDSQRWVEKAIDHICSLVKDPELYRRRIAENALHPEREAFDVLELCDGRIFERYTKPQRVDGQLVGRVVNFRDITERKRAEQQLETIHRQLLEASRQAGMAEVASNVLHNVGNVLNSVNVSANLVADNMRRSKVASLGKVAMLLRERSRDLAEFISGDPRGKHLPEFLLQLSEHLTAEHQESIKELELLRNNIDHIKEIVAMQQTYSKVSGVKEVVSVADLIEDTLRMNSGALQRHGVEVIREFDAMPRLNIEKHKVLQILVNLVRNAKYACSEAERLDKRVTVKVTADDEYVRIAVQDNGMGITPENLTRVFGHGFTTRKDGHGFGLHSGALTARELGGALRVHSDGVGLGAVFTLELPVQMLETSHA